MERADNPLADAVLTITTILKSAGLLEYAGKNNSFTISDLEVVGLVS
jgi:hypothetical protein